MLHHLIIASFCPNQCPIFCQSGNAYRSIIEIQSFNRIKITRISFFNQNFDLYLRSTTIVPRKKVEDSTSKQNQCERCGKKSTK